MGESVFLQDLNLTQGFLFICVLFVTAFWGSGAIQLYFYYENTAKSDRWWIKLGVALIWLLDTAHEVIVAHLVYTIFVKNFSNISYLNHYGTEAAAVILLNAFIDLIVQIMYVMRIWHISQKNKWMSGIAAVLTLVQFSTTTVYFARTAAFTTFTDLQSESILKIELMVNIVLLITDTYISGVLVYLLLRNREELGKMNSLIKSLVFYFIGTGLVIDLVSLTALLTGLLMPKTFVIVGLLMIYPKLYTNSVLVLLNSRDRRRKNLDNEFSALPETNLTFGNSQLDSPSSMETRSMKSGANDLISRSIDRGA
ncbi:hypothetical protein PNOK_0685100 [Pyrrhoderma noxium]|uniref:DUF6534 domain-containing protein n=1 Tax=Pyrrhoderma noxium TaxID=2282107 RepID=A0A286UB56_9AGAM|nr:hypothetical protein PNOK_0685100 [Pyrrhoderma noxium]